MLNASYEIDFWGKNRAALRSAEFTAVASRFDREVIVLSTVSTVINTYFQVLAAQDRLRIARSNVDAATRILKVYQDRIGVGTASGLDIAQQESLVAQQRAAIPPLDQQLRQNIATLAVLLGDAPARVTVRGGSLTGIVAQRVSPGLPSDLLLQRPDIREAEVQLAAANANVESARAALFPSISLTGSGGYVSTALNTLFLPASAVYSVAGSLSQPLFDGFRLLSQLDLQKGRRTELLQLYRKAILSGFGDVERALIAVQDLAEQERLQTEAVATARRAYELSETQLRTGTIDITTVLNTQRTLFAEQDQLVHRPPDATAGDRQPVPGGRRRLGAAGRDRERPRATRGAARQEGRTMKLGRILPIAVVIAIVVAVGAYVFMGKQQEQQKQKRARAFQDQPAPVLVAPARSADVPIYLDAVGNTKALNTATVRPQVGGQIVKILFREGQDVKRGVVLAEIDPRTYQAQYDQAVAKKAQDEATLANARIDLDRYTRLAASNSGSKQQADTQKALVAQLEAQVQGDQAAIDNTRAMLSYTKITAPFDGRTGMRLIDEGNLVQAGDANGVVVITQIQPISVVFNLPQQQYQQVSKAFAQGHAAGRRGGGRRQDGPRSRHAAGDRQPDGSDHRHDPDEGGVSQRAAPALARTVRQRARAGRDAEAGRRGADVGGAARAERNLRLCGRRGEQGRGAAGQGRRSRTTPAR